MQDNSCSQATLFSQLCWNNCLKASLRLGPSFWDMCWLDHQATQKYMLFLRRCQSSGPKGLQPWKPLVAKLQVGAVRLWAIFMKMSYFHTWAGSRPIAVTAVWGSVQYWRRTELSSFDLSARRGMREQVWGVNLAPSLVIQKILDVSRASEANRGQNSFVNSRQAAEMY